jgi:hypothetical protein
MIIHKAYITRKFKLVDKTTLTLVILNTQIIYVFRIKRLRWLNTHVCYECIKVTNHISLSHTHTHTHTHIYI